MKRLLLLTLTFTIVLAKLSLAQIDYKGFAEWSWHQKDSTEYYLYTPSQKSKTGSYPIVLFLHGCCGENNHATLRNTVDPPVRMWHNFGANTQSEPTFIIAPATSRGWKQHIENLKAVIDNLIQNHHGDPQRIYITGFSMGADGTWEFLQRYPNYFAAALPMGMNFHGEHNTIKDIPIWANQGETDPFAKNLRKDIGIIRKLNGYDVDSVGTWITGVNPRYSNFLAYGHVVQWPAASTQDLTGWAYAKVNDGNKYPVVFFQTPAYRQEFKKGEMIPLEIKAHDPDGSISNVVVKVNGRVITTLTKQPYKAAIMVPGGDAMIEAIAFDNKGKSNVATTNIKCNVKTKLLTSELPFARQGAYYTKQLCAVGNGSLRFRLGGGSSLPLGLTLRNNGFISGVPQTAGNFSFTILAEDEDKDLSSMQYRIVIDKKLEDEIVVSNARNDSGTVFPISKLQLSSLTHFNVGDDEVSVSSTAGFDGMTFIPGNAKDTNRFGGDYLSFEVDEDARVYVAYEKKDHLFTSTIPAWLRKWHRLASGQIVTQYFYYDVYYKDFPKGKVVLPGADEKHNNVSNNYFVLVRKAEAPFQFTPQINIARLSHGFLYVSYKEQLTALHSAGRFSWQLASGRLPKGLKLLSTGVLEGTPEAKGLFSFVVQLTDQKGNTIKTTISLEIQEGNE